MHFPVHLFTRLSFMLAVCLTGCKPRIADNPAKPHSRTPAEKLTLARVKISQQCPADEALARSISALSEDFSNSQARTEIEKILAETTWNLPILTLNHELPIQHLAFQEPSSLWVAVAEDVSTVARWNLETLKIEKLLFPTQTTTLRTLIFDRSHRSFVAQRGNVTLLCDALSMKPIGSLGIFPENFTPAAVISFSEDGLLVAHPAQHSVDDPRVIWHLRDVATGEIIRSSEIQPVTAPPALAAFLDRQKLRILHADGSILEIPLSPIEPILTLLPTLPVKLLHAQFTTTGENAITLQDLGPNLAASLQPLNPSTTRFLTTSNQQFLNRFPWTTQPNLWNQLLRDSPTRPFEIQHNTLTIRTSAHAPIHCGTDITAAVFTQETVFTGEQSGQVTRHRLLPPASQISPSNAPAAIDSKCLIALQFLAHAITGISDFDKPNASERLKQSARWVALEHCDLAAIRRCFPSLDFTPTLVGFQTLPPYSALAETLIPLWQRFAQADPSGDSWPRLLDHAKNLNYTDWHHSLTARVAAKLKPVASFPDCPAAQLASALTSEQPELIEKQLAKAVGLPAILRKIAAVRIAWLQGRKADVLAGWPETPPNLLEIRAIEDWEGWEEADFSPALVAVQRCVDEILSHTQIPENSTIEQLYSVIAQLKDPATSAILGQSRYASACLNAATALAVFKDETEITAQLAHHACELGAATAPCLRLEATALTANNHYQQAHDCWIRLITEQAIENQLSTDYTEAAYTAFETQDPRQALEILTTGLERFPNDSTTALRAGWIALLVGHPERAKEFLEHGHLIGFPAEISEKASLLRAIAADQTGENDAAFEIYRDLTTLAPEWREQPQIDALDWPTELKNTLRKIAASKITPDP